LRVLGVDPGTFKMGIGILDSEDGQLTLVHTGVLTARRGQSLDRRLHHLYGELLGIISEWHPGVVAVEEPFVAANVRAAMAVGQAQAVAMVAAAHHGLDIQGYSPREVKRAVTDHGGSAKEQVQEMVKVLLGLPDEWDEPPDATDALAVAICHASASRALDIIIEE